MSIISLDAKEYWYDGSIKRNIYKIVQQDCYTNREDNNKCSFKIDSKIIIKTQDMNLLLNWLDITSPLVKTT